MTDRAWVEACRDIRVNPFTALSFPSLYSWKDTYGLAIGGDADFFVVRSQHDQAYYCPCGDVQKCRAFIEETCGREKEPHFLYLTREQGEQMKKDGFFTLLRDDLSEYIASTAAVCAKNERYALLGDVYTVYPYRFQGYAAKLTKACVARMILSPWGFMEFFWKRRMGGGPFCWDMKTMWMNLP